MIAGLEDITEGELRIGDEVVNDKAPKDRDIAMVFQNYALYPHMSVRDNMGFALKLKRRRQGRDRQEGDEAARILDLEPHLDRKPSQLSGGQRQRVAMGRAIVRDPAAFLMDEPLSNLDAKLRVQMRTEVSRIQQRLGTTTVYVTHDQTEAMTLGDRVAVMRAGLIQQVGSPMELYNEPVNLFVAGFIGSPAMNFMPATVEGDTVKLPFGGCDAARASCASAVREHRRQAADRGHPARELRGRRAGRRRAATVARPSRRTSRCVESMGSELYAHFSVASDATIESAGAARAGRGRGRRRGPDGGRGGPHRGAARSRQRGRASGKEAELWVDATRLHLFDPENGSTSRWSSRGRRRPPATAPDGRLLRGGAPADTSQDVTGEEPDAREGAQLRPRSATSRAAPPAARPDRSLQGVVTPVRARRSSRSRSASPDFGVLMTPATRAGAGQAGLLQLAPQVAHHGVVVEPGVLEVLRIASTTASSHSCVRSSR